MPVNILNLPGLRVSDFKETDAEYHVRDLPSHGKAVAVHLDVPRLKCRPCDQTFTAAVSYWTQVSISEQI